VVVVEYEEDDALPAQQTIAHCEHHIQQAVCWVQL
jgi:hypothetical protein